MYVSIYLFSHFHVNFPSKVIKLSKNCFSSAPNLSVSIYSFIHNVYMNLIYVHISYLSRPI